ncbi:lysophospholipid acyltransferase family protein [Blastococcus sp. TF02A-35]|uniref:lysophospholipid acyltransferase family protein n=1 Tax=Blastococcus sp. TF02A-35 TaxID=2559612 RepID=UPI0014315805|nr:lysophospholipid acyltransferase family protein [Blastococcus sp. TF02A_35]
MDTPAPPAGRTLRARRWTELSAALAGAAAGVPGAAPRALAALGVELRVLPPAVPWRLAGEGPAPLVVANHVSWLDDVALLAAFPALRPVAKVDVAAWPVVGAAARRSGAVFLDRGSLRRLPGTVAEVADLLRAGTPVLVHPEGTTSCGSRPGRFRPAFFQAAVDAGAPVCPVALRYRTPAGPTAVAGYLGGDSLRRSLARVIATQGLVLELHQLAPLHPGSDRRDLAALAEYAVAAAAGGREPTRTPHRPFPTVPVLPADLVAP